MTAEELKELNAKMLNEMKMHLTVTVNYPDCTYEDVMSQVPYMWNLLVHKGLTRPGMSYEIFHYFANKSYTKAVINRTIGI